MSQQLYGTVVNAVRRVLQAEAGGDLIRLSRAHLEGELRFEDSDGKVLKALPAETLFKKLTAVREKLRVMEQKINNHEALLTADRLDLQAALTRCYAAIAAFTPLFRESPVEQPLGEDEAVSELVLDAVWQALAEEAGGADIRLTRRMVEGEVNFLSPEGQLLMTLPAEAFFRKVTALHSRLHRLDQKILQHSRLPGPDRSELRTQLARCAGSLTTFNFLIRDEKDHFVGTGG